jgi:predicted porin
MKKVLFAAVASSLAVSAFAEGTSNVTIYGSMDAGVAHITNMKATNGSGSATRLDQGTMQPDRFGFRGTEDLGGNMKAFFQLEGGFYTDTGTQPGATGNLFGRTAMVGLSSNYGAVSMGHMPDLVYDYVGKLSNAYQLTNWYLFHPGNYDSLANTFQPSNVVRYTSPNFSGLQVSGMYGFGEVANDSKAGRNVSAGATYTNGPLRAALAMTRLNNPAEPFGASFLNSVMNKPLATVATPLDSLTTLAAGIGYTIGNLRLNADFTQVKFDLPDGYAVNGNALPKQRNFDLGAAWNYAAAETLNAGYSLSKLEDGRWNTFSLSNVHHFSKTTELYAQITYQRTSGGVDTALVGAGAAGGQGVGSGSSQTVTTIGVHHMF